MKTVAFLLGFVFLAQLASGQETGAGQPMKKNLFAVSYSPISGEGLKTAFRSSSSMGPTLVEGNYGFAAVGYNNPKYSGIFLLTYGRRLAPGFDMTFDVGYEQQWTEWKLYNNPERITDRLERTHYLYFMVNPTWVYYSRRSVDLYMSFGAGARTMWDNAARLDPWIESVSGTDFVYQVCLFGFRVRCNDWLGFMGSFEAGYLGIMRVGVFANW